MKKPTEKIGGESAARVRLINTNMRKRKRGKEEEV